MDHIAEIHDQNGRVRQGSYNTYHCGTGIDTTPGFPPYEGTYPLNDGFGYLTLGDNQGSYFNMVDGEYIGEQITINNYFCQKMIQLNKLLYGIEFSKNHKYTGYFNGGKTLGKAEFADQTKLDVLYEPEGLSDTINERGLIYWCGEGYIGHEYVKGSNSQCEKILDDGTYVKGDISIPAEYKGYLKNGRAHGQGIMTFGNGFRYEGTFWNGFRHGYGKLFKENDVFEGLFLRNVPKRELPNFEELMSLKLECPNWRKR